MLEGESLVRFPFPSGKPLGLASILSMRLSNATLSRTASRRSVRVLVNIRFSGARVLLIKDQTHSWRDFGHWQRILEIVVGARRPSGDR
jgi:hypothetical protein